MNNVQFRFAFCFAMLFSVPTANGTDEAFGAWRKYLPGTWTIGKPPIVVWKAEYRPTTEGAALIGEWTQVWQWNNGPPTKYATEIIGWRRDQKVIKSIGFGISGLHWELVLDEVTEKELVGRFVLVYPLQPGPKSLEGRIVISQEDDDTIFIQTTCVENELSVHRNFRIFRQRQDEASRTGKTTDSSKN